MTARKTLKTKYPIDTFQCVHVLRRSNLCFCRQLCHVDDIAEVASSVVFNHGERDANM